MILINNNAKSWLTPLLAFSLGLWCTCSHCTAWAHISICFFPWSQLTNPRGPHPPPLDRNSVHIRICYKSCQMHGRLHWCTVDMLLLWAIAEVPSVAELWRIPGVLKRQRKFYQKRGCQKGLGLPTSRDFPEWQWISTLHGSVLW